MLPAESDRTLMEVAASLCNAGNCLAQPFPDAATIDEATVEVWFSCLCFAYVLQKRLGKPVRLPEFIESEKFVRLKLRLDERFDEAFPDKA